MPACAERGWCSSARGPGGGYRLAKTAGETVHRRDRPRRGRAAPRHPLRRLLAQGLHDEGRTLPDPRPLGGSRRSHIEGYLASVSLADVDHERPARRGPNRRTWVWRHDQRLSDYNATARRPPGSPRRRGPGPGGRAAIPSSVHAAGRASARASIEQAREACRRPDRSARCQSVVFTSGGTEANASGHRKRRGRRRQAPDRLRAIEHALPGRRPPDRVGQSPSRCCRWTARRRGRSRLVKVPELAACDAADGKPLVALMLANNETGVIQPVAARPPRPGPRAGGWPAAGCMSMRSRRPARSPSTAAR